MIYDGPRWIAFQARDDTVQVCRHKGDGLIGGQAIERWPDLTFDELERRLFGAPDPTKTALDERRERFVAWQLKSRRDNELDRGMC